MVKIEIRKWINDLTTTLPKELEDLILQQMGVGDISKKAIAERKIKDAQKIINDTKKEAEDLGITLSTNEV